MCDSTTAPYHDIRDFLTDDEDDDIFNITLIQSGVISSTTSNFIHIKNH